MKKYLLLFLLSFFAFVQNIDAQPANSKEVNSGRILTRTIRSIGGKSTYGKLDLNICQIAVDFARDMAKGKKPFSHNGFQSRCAKFKGRHKEEIIAMATAWKAHHAAKIITQNWLNSPGHKAAMMKYQDRFGYALIRSKHAGPGGYTWYAVGLFARN